MTEEVNEDIRKESNARNNRSRLRKTIKFVLFLVAFLYFVYGLSPLLQKNISKSKILLFPEVQSLIETATSKLEDPGQTVKLNGNVNVSSFVAMDVTVYVKSSDQKATFRPKVEMTDVESGPLQLRYDRIVLFLGTLSIFVLMVLTLSSEQSSAIKAVRAVNTKQGSDDEETDLFGHTAELFLEKEVYYAQKRTEDLFSRSTLLLACGIVMAFVGVIIFYITLPEVSLENWNLKNYLAQIIRPTGVLIFVEAIAWFLLRQYRNLIEDYKVFHKMYLKRSNYLIVLKTLKTKNAPDADLIMVTSLLSEDLTGKLVAGETTESLENKKLKENNPVFDIVRQLVDRNSTSANNEK